jgi:hypothetical protein
MCAARKKAGSGQNADWPDHHQQEAIAHSDLINIQNVTLHRCVRKVQIVGREEQVAGGLGQTVPTLRPWASLMIEPDINSGYLAMIAPTGNDQLLYVTAIGKKWTKLVPKNIWHRASATTLIVRFGLRTEIQRESHPAQVGIQEKASADFNPAH